MQNACDAVQYSRGEAETSEANPASEEESDSESEEIDNQINNQKCKTWRPRGTNMTAMILGYTNNLVSDATLI
jgi:hypothetical protein